MKPSIRLLDCTLREAPLNDLMWGDMSIRKMLDSLKKANVDIIEVGFLKNAEYKIGSTSFCRVEEIEPYLENKNQENRDTLYAALVDYGRYNITNLSENDGKSIDIIRICFKHNEINNVIDYAQEIRDKGYKISIQHVDTLGFSDQEIVDFIEKINVFKPFAYSIVDTFGAMYEDDMLRLTRLVTEHLDENILLGFHGHNNLMLADANSQKFIEQVSPNRNIIVDSSLYGCGRSAGNAHTELMAQYLNKKFSANYNIDEMLDLIDTVIATAQEKTSWGYSIPYFIAGMHDAHTFNAKQLLKRHNLRSKDLRGILGLLNDTQKKAYDYALLEKLYIEYFDKPIDDQESIQKLRKAWQGRTILLLAPGKTVQECRYVQIKNISWDLCGKQINYNGFSKTTGLAQIDPMNPKKYQKKLNPGDFIKGDFNIGWFAINEHLRTQLKPRNKIRLEVQDTLGNRFYSQKYKYKEFLENVRLALETNKKVK